MQGDNDKQNPHPSSENWQAKEIHYRRLFETAPDGILVVDAETGNIIDVNPVLIEKFGYPRQDIINKPIWETGFLKAVFSDKNKLEELKQQDSVFIEDLSLETFAGGTLSVDLSVKSYEVEHHELIQLRLQLSRERKEARLKLDKSELRFHKLIEESPIGIALSQQGNTIFANASYVKMFGFESPEELLGTSFLDLIATQSRAEVLEMVTRFEHGRTQNGDYVFQGLGKDGSEFPFQASIAPVELEDGIALIGYFIDITKRKQAEIENQILRDRTEMSTRLAAVGEMAAGIAHEINNPLTGIIGFSELLSGRSDLPDDVREELKIINDGSTRVKEIVSRMLTFARQTKPTKSRICITDLLDNTLELRSYVLKTSNIVVTRDYDPQLPWVTVDAGQLQQVFLNIIVNAEYALKKANNEGILTIKTELVDDHICIAISDNGTGMSDEIKAKLFQPFFTTKGPAEGTGLGLSLSHGIIQEHGGTIRAESALGQGTTFIIELPVTLEIPRPEKVAVPDIIEPVTGAKILVVDDEPTVRTLIRAILTQDGHTVEVFENSTQVLTKLKEAKYDILLVDLRMPGMNGMELYTEISTRWPELAQRVIFITGDTSDLNTQRYLAAHEIPFISKPFDRKTIEATVNQALLKNQPPLNQTKKGNRT